jgi:hypothetical protein
MKACRGGSRSEPKQEACPNCLGNQESMFLLAHIFRNGVECMSAILVFQDIDQNAEVMKQKEYFGEKYPMPNGMEIPAHAADVLRQKKGANLVEGG